MSSNEIPKHVYWYLFIPFAVLASMTGGLIYSIGDLWYGGDNCHKIKGLTDEFCASQISQSHTIGLIVFTIFLLMGIIGIQYKKHLDKIDNKGGLDKA